MRPYVLMRPRCSRRPTRTSKSGHTSQNMLGHGLVLGSEVVCDVIYSLYNVVYSLVDVEAMCRSGGIASIYIYINTSCVCVRAHVCVSAQGMNKSARARACGFACVAGRAYMGQWVRVRVRRTWASGCGCGTMSARLRQGCPAFPQGPHYRKPSTLNFHIPSYMTISSSKEYHAGRMAPMPRLALVCRSRETVHCRAKIEAAYVGSTLQGQNRGCIRGVYQTEAAYVGSTKQRLHTWGLHLQGNNRGCIRGVYQTEAAYVGSTKQRLHTWGLPNRGCIRGVYTAGPTQRLHTWGLRSAIFSCFRRPVPWQTNIWGGQ